MIVDYWLIDWLLEDCLNDGWLFYCFVLLSKTIEDIRVLLVEILFSYSFLQLYSRVKLSSAETGDVMATSQHRSQSQSHRSHDQARMETSQVRRSSDGDQGTRNGDSPNRPFIGHLSPMLCSHWLKMNLWPSLMAALDGSGAREHCSVGHCWQRDSCSSALDCSLSGQEEASQVSLVLVSSLDFTCINSVKLKIDIDGGIY